MAVTEVGDANHEGDDRTAQTAKAPAGVANVDERSCRPRPAVGEFGDILPHRDMHMLLGLSHLTTSFFWGLAHSYQSNYGIVGPSCFEDSRVRLLLSLGEPSKMLIELNSACSNNMMDPGLAIDFDYMMDTYKHLRGRMTPMACVLQGVGPHFCPGGNHRPSPMPGATAWTYSARAYSSMAFIRLGELAIPVVTAVHGSLIGGGVALSLLTGSRAAASSATLCYGNASRSACPLMHLSKNLPAKAGLSVAMDLYLTDASLSAYAALKAGLLTSVVPSILGAKRKAFSMAHAAAYGPVLSTGPVMDNMRISDEALGFQRAMMESMEEHLRASKEVSLHIRGPVSHLKMDLGDGEGAAVSKSAALPRVLRQDHCDLMRLPQHPRPFPQRPLRRLARRCKGRPMSVYAQVALNLRCSSCGEGEGAGQLLRGEGIYASELYCLGCWQSWEQCLERTLGTASCEDSDFEPDEC